MTKEMYSVVVLLQDYKRADATCITVVPTMERAKKGMLRLMAEELFQYIKEDLLDGDEAAWNKWVDDRYVTNKKDEVLWVNDDGDSVAKIYINKTTVHIDSDDENAFIERGKYEFHAEEDNLSVYEKDSNGGLHIAGNIMNMSTGDIEDLTDGEFDEMLRQNGIF